MIQNSPCRVLVVDDDPTIRELVVALLADMGMTAVEAAHGGEVLELIEREHFDFMVLDVDMPVMSGYELCRRLKEMGRGIPTLILSAYDAHRVAEELGAEAGLEKPFDINEFALQADTLCSLAHDRAASATTGDPGSGA